MTFANVAPAVVEWLVDTPGKNIEDAVRSLAGQGFPAVENDRILLCSWAIQLYAGEFDTQHSLGVPSKVKFRGSTPTWSDFVAYDLLAQIAPSIKAALPFRQPVQFFFPARNRFEIIYHPWFTPLAAKVINNLQLAGLAGAELRSTTGAVHNILTEMYDGCWDTPGQDAWRASVRKRLRLTLFGKTVQVRNSW